MVSHKNMLQVLASPPQLVRKLAELYSLSAALANLRIPLLVDSLFLSTARICAKSNWLARNLFEIINSAVSNACWLG